MSDIWPLLANPLEHLKELILGKFELVTYQPAISISGTHWFSLHSDADRLYHLISLGQVWHHISVGSLKRCTVTPFKGGG